MQLKELILYAKTEKICLKNLKIKIRTLLKKSPIKLLLRKKSVRASKWAIPLMSLSKRRGKTFSVNRSKLLETKLTVKPQIKLSS
jgi:hypothetical protein